MAIFDVVQTGTESAAAECPNNFQMAKFEKNYLVNPWPEQVAGKLPETSAKLLRPGLKTKFQRILEISTWLTIGVRSRVSSDSTCIITC